MAVEGRDDGRVSAVVLAGGDGDRAGGALPKQLVSVAGEPVLTRTLWAMRSATLFDQVVVAANPKWLPETEALARSVLVGIEHSVVPGGVSRLGSLASAVDQLPGADHRVVVHDAVRPLVDVSLLRRVADELLSADAVVPTVGSADALVDVSAPGHPIFIPRSSVRRVQSPQGFWSAMLTKALASVESRPLDRFETIFELLQHTFPMSTTAVIDGNQINMKITYAHDHALVEALLRYLAGSS